MAGPETKILPDNLLSKGDLARFMASLVEPRAGAGRSDPAGIAGVLEDIKALWKEKGFLTPAQTKAELLISYLPAGEDPSVAETIRKQAAFEETPEQVTGYLSKDHGHTLDALAHLYALETGTPVTRLAGDFTNLSGLNKHFIEVLRHSDPMLDKATLEKQAFEMANNAMSVICKAVTDELRKSCKEYPGAQFVMYRAGGDEMNGVLIGVPPEKVQAILDNVHNAIEVTVASVGLQDHKHTKEDRQANCHNGSGLVFSAKPLDKNTNPYTLSHEQDMEMGVQKIHLGHDRIGTIDQEMAEAEEKRAARMKGKTLSPEDLKLKLGQRQRAALRRKDQLHKLNPYPHYNDVRGGVSLLGEKETIADYIKAWMAKILGEKKAAPTPPIDPAAVKNAPLMSSMLDRAALAARQHYEEKGVKISPQAQKIVESAARGLYGEDPSSRTAMVQEISDTIQAYVQEAPRYAAQRGLKPEDSKALALGVSFHGLGAINGKFGHDVADVFLRHAANDVIAEAMKEAGVKPDQFLLAHHGGGNFSMAVKPMDGQAAAMDKFERALERRTKELNSQNITDIVAKHDPDLAVGMKAKFDESSVKKFSDLADVKSREFEVGGQKIKGSVDGIHVAVVKQAIEDTPPAAVAKQAIEDKALAADEKNATPQEKWTPKGFIGKLRDAADKAVDKLREGILLQKNPIPVSRSGFTQKAPVPSTPQPAAPPPQPPPVRRRSAPASTAPP